jgi:hypothetical protein
LPRSKNQIRFHFWDKPWDEFCVRRLYFKLARGISRIMVLDWAISCNKKMKDRNSFVVESEIIYDAMCDFVN